MDRKAIYTMLLVLSMLLALISSSGAVSAPYWIKTYGGDGEDSGFDIEKTPEGGFLVGGSTSSFGAGRRDGWLIKLDKEGKIEWEKTYGGPNLDSINSVNNLPDGEFMVSGSTRSFGLGLDDIWIIKLDNLGNIKFQATYGGRGDDDVFSEKTTDGGYILGGRTSSFGAGVDDAWILKLDADGRIEWEKTYGSTKVDEVRSVKQTSDGGFIAVGRTNFFGAGERDFWVLKLNALGDIEWEKTYGGTSFEQAFSVLETVDGKFIVIGHTYSFGAGRADAWILKLDRDGTVEWQKTYGGAEEELARSVLQTADGGFLLTGQSYSFGPRGSDAWLMKLDEEGNIEWSKVYSGSDFDRAWASQELDEGGYISAARTYSFGAGLDDVWVLKVDADGNVADTCALIVDAPVIITETTATVTDSTAIVLESSAGVSGVADDWLTSSAKEELQCISCPDTIIIDGCDTGVSALLDDGTCLQTAVDICAETAKNHGQFVSCVTELKGLIDGKEFGKIVSCAAKADIPE